MDYVNVIPATFLARPNRFLAVVEVNGQKETVHVKNTGRCRELLVPGCRVWLSEASNPARKTKYDLIASEKARSGKPPMLVNLDSQVVNDAAEEWLRQGALFGKDAVIRREVTWGNSRFDFYIESGERKIFLEVKGCTLERDGICLFPDAPTVRGVKHLHELTACLDKGYEAYLLIVIQMQPVRVFCPNDETDPDFGRALREAVEKGVRILAMDCRITPDSICLCHPVPVQLT